MADDRRRHDHDHQGDVRRRRRGTTTTAAGDDRCRGRPSHGRPRPPRGRSPRGRTTTAAGDDCRGGRMPRGTITAEDEPCGDIRHGGRPRSSRETTAAEDGSSGDAGAGNTGAGGHGRKETRAQGCGGARTGTGGRGVWGSGTWTQWVAAVRGRRDAAARGRSAARRGTRGGEDGRTGARRRRAATPLLPCTMPLSHGTWGALARRRRHGELRLAAARRLAIDGGPVSCGRRRPRILPSLTLQHLGDGGGSTSRG